MRALAVTGTDTGVGKTVVTAAVAALARAGGQRVAVVKPAQTGVGPDEPGDLAEVRRLGGGDDLHELARYPEPLAPATAARRQRDNGVPVSLVTAYLRTLGDRDLVLVEGAGGLLVHFDAGGTTLADLGVPVLVVVRAGLGTLNHAALTCEALRSRGLECAGVVIGAWPSDPDLADRCNLADLPRYTGVPLRGVLPDGASRLDPTRFLATARAGLAPELGGDWKGTT
ncbi:MAG: dethiobiotin synthase [Mycobacteriales bacterium]